MATLLDAVFLCARCILGLSRYMDRLLESVTEQGFCSAGAEATVVAAGSQVPRWWPSGIWRATWPTPLLVVHRLVVVVEKDALLAWSYIFSQ